MLCTCVALDLDMANNRVFWCDRFYRKIYSAFIHDASDPSQQVPLVDSSLQTPVGLALDWLQHNLYWTDSGDKSISVASVDGTKRRVLINTDLSEPRAIALDPHHGFMYWSDWGTRAKIEKAGMNGVDRQVLVANNIEWPNGITLDVANRRLYWVDSKLHHIASVDLNGAHRRTHISSAETLGHPYALAVFEDRIYWTDRDRAAVFVANRLTGQEVHMLAENLNDPHDIVVFHQLRQPRGQDSCNLGSVANGGCEYLCLKAPQITEHSPKYTCTCPDGQGDAVLHLTTAASSTEELATSLSALRTASSNESKESDYRSTASAVVVSTTPAGDSSVSQHCECLFLAISLCVVKIIIFLSFARIPIVATVVFGLVCTGVYLVWRNWRTNSTKSMNFDNPVYRKTTGEGEEDEIHIGRTDADSADDNHLRPAGVSDSFDSFSFTAP
uniref:LDL receptor related protein 8 n=1 Tax=Cynoglossus semilaevis TaxID=244447 RepID=A0A3P8VTU1_CYNSE